MSTIAGMYYMRTPGTTTPAAQDIQPSSECSEMDPETNLNLSEDDNTSCSASDMGCDLSLSTTSHNNNNKDSSSPSSFSSSRKNKRKNFKPRNILEYAGSDEEQEHHHNHSQSQLQGGLNNNKGRNYVNHHRRGVHQITPGDDADEDEDDDEQNEASEGSDKVPRNGIMNLRMDLGESHHPMLMNGRMRNKAGSDDEEDGDSDDYTSNIRRRGAVIMGSSGPSDGPLDLSDIQNESNKPSWHSSKDKSLPMRSPPSPHSVHSLLNNNVLDPAAFLHGHYSHHNSLLSMGLSPSQAAVAAAAAAMGMGMDLRMSGGGGSGNRNTSSEGLLYESQEPRSNDNAISSSTTHQQSSSISNNNNNLSTNNNHQQSQQHPLQGLSNLHPNHPHHHQPSASVLSDFAENTMKELLSLYGIAENFRQAGGKSELLNMHGSLDTPSGHPSKMMLPENMARLLAAMHESVNAAGSHHHNLNNPIDHSTQSSQSSVTSNSKGNHLQHSSHHPLNFANINTLVQQPLVSSAGSPVRSPSSVMNGGGITNSNGGNSGGANNSLSGGASLNHHLRGDGGSNGSSSNNGHLFSHKPKSRSSQGRGLTSFPVIREGLLGKGTGPVDYTRYVRRFSNAVECGYGQCRELNYREHFHCQECSDGTRVFVKKEEMIRHFKWHKKRDESLQHGFMRYSPMDDCSDKFPNCSHNRKQTHYHCLKDGCEKVYISTSDVQMHANYHRKDSAIIQEGFQRFRAAEDCGSDHCSFRHQKTTHFHCRRPTCSFTFKNKADMEKHKSYHIKDEQLNRDGFKKFMKHEECQYPNCRFSRVCNHIHCIREGCNYVLHSSGQLYSHKRKHERRDAELAYRKYKLAQSLMKGTFGPDFASLNESLLVSSIKSEEENSRSSLNDGLSSGATPTSGNNVGGGCDGESASEDGIKKFIQLCNCDVTHQEHFHCKVDSCLNALLGSLEVAAEHGKNHELEDKISSLAYFTVDPANFDAQDSTIPCISAKCPYQTREKHYHCLWDGCSEVILATDEPFKRLEHFRVHQHTQKMEIVGDKEGPVGEAMDGFFRRKRGRPPKNRVIEVSSGANEAIYTSFKLPKPSIPGLSGDGMEEFDSKDPIGFVSYPEGASCPDPSCPYHESSSTCHYHCGHPRCHFSVSDVHKLSNHLREFHSSCDVLENYEYFDKNSNCSMKMCPFDGTSDHFHCTRDNFSCFKHLEIMAHESECHEGKSGSSSDDEGASDSKKSGNGASVKASGTFYPTYSLDKAKITSNGGGNNPMDLSSPNGGAPDSGSESKSVTDHSLSRILQIPSSGDNGETQYGPEAACGRPFCKLKRKHHYHCHLCNQAFSELEKLRPHVLKHSNVSPSKIPDSEEHSTDDEGSSAIQTPEDNPSRSSPHLSSSNKLRSSPSSTESAAPNHPFPKFDPFPSSPLSNFLSYPGAHSPYLFLQQNPLTSLYAGMMFGGSGGSVTAGTGGTSSSSPSFPIPIPHPQSGGSVSLRGASSPPAGLLSTTPEASSSPLTPQNMKRPPSASPSSPASPSEAKKARMQMRILKDEPVPEGYIRFRFNEDCAYVHCGYREHQTHFHCTREDCGYSFCDKTRFVQHTARHERLDTLMGGDFKQFRANVSCGRPDCAYKTAQGVTQAQNKASHFHCSKCDFVCTDTNKVVAHRRQHQKLDSIMAAGFEKFTPSQNCQIEGCIHSLKQTHYHCLKCGYAVLGLSQMSAHKYRHVD